MSSFVIGKKEYVKASAFIGAIAESATECGSPIIYIYSCKLGRVYNAQDYYDRFCKMYEDNAKSVQLQYGDDEPETDENDYMTEYLQTKEKAKQLYRRAICSGEVSAFKKACSEFIDFSACVHYQIEDEKIAKRTNPFMNRLCMYLFKITLKMDDIVTDNWGEFDI